MATSTIIFVLSLVGLIILGQLQRIELFPLPGFYLHDLLMLIWAWWLTANHWQLIKKVAKNAFSWSWLMEWLLVGWIALGWLMAVASGNFSSLALAYSLRFLVYAWVFFWLWRSRSIRANQIKGVTIMTGLFLLAWGFGQYIFMPDMRFLTILGWDDHFNRLIGTQFDPNYMGIIFVLLFFQLQSLRVQIKTKWFVVILELLTLLGLALTFSRSAFLSLGVVTVLAGGLKFKKYWPVVVLLALIWLVPKPGGEGVDLSRTASIEARLSTSKQGLVDLEGGQWLVGQGWFNTPKSSYAAEEFRRADHAALSDNIILLVLQASGVVGLVLTTLVGLKWSRRLYKRSPRSALYLLAVFSHALFNNSLFQPFVFIYLGLILEGEVDG